VREWLESRCSACGQVALVVLVPEGFVPRSVPAPGLCPPCSRDPLKRADAERLAASEEARS
jgi:hypothetical protein